MEIPIANENVHAAEAFRSQFYQPPTLFLPCDVGYGPCGPFARRVDLPSQCLELFAASRSHDDPGSPPGEFPGQRQPDAGRCSRDDDSLFLEIHVFS